MEVKHISKLTRIEAKKLSEIKEQNLAPLRDLLLNYVEDTTNQITVNVKLNLTKEITNSNTTANLQHVGTN